MDSIHLRSALSKIPCIGKVSLFRVDMIMLYSKKSEMTQYFFHLTI